MLYSIGYQRLSVDQFLMKLKENHIEFLLDVRSRPFSRKPGFSRDPLKESLAREEIHYLWKGDCLGGMSKICEEDIQWLAKWQEGKMACLMCMEADPDRCHRKTEIARRLDRYQIPVEHIIT